jgi:hypothetical protein
MEGALKKIQNDESSIRAVKKLGFRIQAWCPTMMGI